MHTCLLYMQRCGKTVMFSGETPSSYQLGNWPKCCSASSCVINSHWLFLIAGVRMRYKRLMGEKLSRVLLFVRGFLFFFCLCVFIFLFFLWITRGLGRYIGCPSGYFWLVCCLAHVLAVWVAVLLKEHMSWQWQLGAQPWEGRGGNRLVLKQVWFPLSWCLLQSHWCVQLDIHMPLKQFSCRGAVLSGTFALLFAPVCAWM